ncbi:hypothetical protein [Paracoccus sp. (in: a-proteobacteria)]|uniref:hypothetical protein n=1 Tax=Paracoccus sp. TaxID=267 RepID=UPI0026DFFB54|nr:hypothetical protein [Paracoccus sp. (in: a-proteobacteria)]MDO5648268.1 hypothetical protein [Paracoccus sp. (in: a-proteobacteria)]
MLRRLGRIACLAAPVAAVAQDIVDATDPDVILNLMRGFGSARLGVDAIGDPKIEGRIDGIPYILFFNNCTENRDCKAVQFYTYWTNVGDITADHLTLGTGKSGLPAPVWTGTATRC